MSESQVKGKTVSIVESERTPDAPTIADAALTTELSSVVQGRSLRSLRAETEIHAVTQALEQTGWNRKRAAQLLKISYRGLLYKIQQHKITPAARDGECATDQAKVS